MVDSKDKSGGNHKRACERRYKAIIFDVDGTLYRLRPLKRAVQFYFLRKNWHRPLEAWKVHKAIRAYRDAIDQLREEGSEGADLKTRQIDIATHASLLREEIVRESVKRWMEEEPLAFLRKFRLDGAEEVLCEFRQHGMRLGVFSDFPARKKLKALGIERFFDVVLSAHDADVQRFKPHPRGLEVALERLGVQAKDAVYVGDRHSIDGVAAERAGMGFLIAGDGHLGRADTFWRLREILLPENS